MIAAISWLYRLNFGGVEVRAKNLEGALAAHYPTEVIYARNLFTKPEGGNPFTETGLFLWRNPYSNKGKNKRQIEEKFIAKASKYLQGRKSEYAFVSGQAINATAGLQAGLPTIVHMHGVDRWIADPPALEKSLVEGSHPIAAISEDIRQKLIAHGVAAGRINVIPNGVDVAGVQKIVAATTDEAFKHVFPELEPGKFVLSVGQLIPLKNFTRALHAFKEIVQANPELKYAIVGAGELRKQLQAQVAELGLQDKVLLLGHLDQKLVFALYAKALTLFAPSLIESWGLTVFEAMAAGLPVITSARTGASKVISDQAVVVADPENQAEVNSALQAIVSDNSLRQRLITKGEQLASKYSWEASSANYLELCRDLFKL
jgi:glycosyltransferase involved in cell wall biosynthesis